MSDKTPSHTAYTVAEREGKDANWHCIGAAWPTQDGGFTLVLESLPLRSRIVLRPYKPPKAGEEK